LGKKRRATQRDGRQLHSQGSEESRRCGGGSSNSDGYDGGLVPFRGPMESFLEFVIRQLVDAPEEVLITRLEQGRKLVFKVEMRQSDVGKIIGRNGHTITALRNLLSAAAARTGQQIVLQIVE
jgi:uncharacterized protein